MNAWPALTTASAAWRTSALPWLRRWCLTGMLAVLSAAAWAQAAPLPAVVVWDFENQTPGSSAAAERSDFLKRSLSESLTATLLQVAGLPVVERQHLKDLLAEQKLSAGALADADTRLRLGKIIGAQRMVFGGYFVLGEAVQVHVRLVDTATSRVLFSDEAAMPLADVMTQVVPMNRRLATALAGAGAGAAATGQPSEHAAEIWQAYDRALALADAGDFDAAVLALQGLLKRDKNFLPAERQLVALLERMARR